MIGELDGGFTILRATVESALEAPFSVTVTSARPGDGKTEVAVGLARAFGAAGYRTILIDANAGNPTVGEALGVGRLRVPSTLDDAAGLPLSKITPYLDASSIADGGLTNSSSTVALRSFMEELRGRYTVTIYDAGDAFESPLALQCSAASEGTLVAVRFGRRPTPEDTRLVAMLEQVGGRIIGVVPTECPSGRRTSDGKVRQVPFATDELPSGVRRAGKSTA